MGMDALAKSIREELSVVNARATRLMAALRALGEAEAIGAKKQPAPKRRRHYTARGTARRIVLDAIAGAGRPVVHRDLERLLPNMPIGTISGTMHFLRGNGLIAWADTGYVPVLPNGAVASTVQPNVDEPAGELVTQ